MQHFIRVHFFLHQQNLLWLYYTTGGFLVYVRFPVRFKKQGALIVIIAHVWR